MELNDDKCDLCLTNCKVLTHSHNKEHVKIISEILNKFALKTNLKKQLNVCLLCIYKLQKLREINELVDTKFIRKKRCRFCSGQQNLVHINEDFDDFFANIQTFTHIDNSSLLICTDCYFYFDTLNTFKCNLQPALPEAANKRKRTGNDEDSVIEKKSKGINGLSPIANDTALSHIEIKRAAKSDVKMYKYIAYVNLVKENLEQSEKKATKPLDKSFMKIKLKKPAPKQAKSKRTLSPEKSVTETISISSSDSPQCTIASEVSSVLESTVEEAASVSKEPENKDAIVDIENILDKYIKEPNASNSIVILDDDYDLQEVEIKPVEMSTSDDDKTPDILEICEEKAQKAVDKSSDNEITLVEEKNGEELKKGAENEDKNSEKLNGKDDKEAPEEDEATKNGTTVNEILESTMNLLNVLREDVEGEKKEEAQSVEDKVRKLVEGSDGDQELRLHDTSSVKTICIENGKKAKEMDEKENEAEKSIDLTQNEDSKEDDSLDISQVESVDLTESPVKAKKKVSFSV